MLSRLPKNTIKNCRFFSWTFSNVSSVLQPHPEKRRGEDAIFKKSNVLGVFDGVGGWSSVGVDPAEFPLCLVQQLSGQEFTDQNLRNIIDNSVKSCSLQFKGSTTVSLVALNDGKLNTLNIGDSGFLILRKVKDIYQIIHKSRDIVHGFNFPAQVGSGGDCPMKSGDEQTFSVESGDVIFLATDGVWDNCFDEDILKIINENDNLSENVTSQIVKSVCDLAYHRAIDYKSITPWSVKEKEHFKIRRPHFGGKLDDISAIIGIVVKNE